jgi:hypothetical protein
MTSKYGRCIVATHPAPKATDFKRGWRVAIALGLLCFVAVFLTGSRVAWLLGVLVFFGGLMLLWYRQRAPRSAYAVGFAIVALILLAGFTNYPISGVFWGLAVVVWVGVITFSRFQKSRRP